MPSCLARAVTFESMRSLMMEPGHTLLTRMPSRPTSSARRLGERDHAQAGDAGEHQVGDGLVDGAGQDVDDAAGALPLEVRQRLAAHPPEEEERALHRGLPLLLGGALGLGQGRAARVVHQDVEAPEPGRRWPPPGRGWSRAGRGRRRRPAPRARSRPGSRWRPSPDRPCDRLQIATCAPSCASTSAQARPRPLLAPPTIATLSRSSRSMGQCYTTGAVIRFPARRARPGHPRDP